MKWVLPLVFLTFLLLKPVFVFAENTPTPTPQVQIQYTNEFSVQNQPSDIITLLKNFISGLDSILGGFIFYTPNPLTSTISLKDGTQITGVTKYKDLFNQIAVPVLAIVIAAFAIAKIGSDNAAELKSFALRFLIVMVLFLTVPTVLSYSIQANNLLVDKISSTQQFTGFLNNYLDQSQQQINQNKAPEKFGIPSFDISLKGGILQSLGKFILQVFLFALTFLFLLGGFLFIGFQFAIRFATLLFLGVLYPIVIPFMLTEKTQHIVYSFFRTWFTALIQQPAFVLGFAIATDIFKSLLSSSGPSVGMLFLYTGFLFFLGGVTMLTANIFGEAWNVAHTIVHSNIASSRVKQSLSSISSIARHNLIPKTLNGLSTATSSNHKSGNYSYTPARKPFSPRPINANNGSQFKKHLPQFSYELSRKGLNAKVENPKQGIVSLTGAAYSHQNKKTGLTSIYPSQLEAMQDGAPTRDLNKVSLNNAHFVDLSAFSKVNPNPHNENAMLESKKRGKDLSFAYVKSSSPPGRVRNFLNVAKERNDALGIKGVIIKRHGSRSSDQIIRIYSDQKL